MEGGGQGSQSRVNDNTHRQLHEAESPSQPLLLRAVRVRLFFTTVRAEKLDKYYIEEGKEIKPGVRSIGDRTVAILDWSYTCCKPLEILHTTLNSLP